MMIRLFCLAAMTLIPALSAGAAVAAEPARSSGSPGRTIIHDRAGAQKLRGNDGITLQWISWDRRGDLSVTQQDDALVLHGGQMGDDGKAMLSIDGYVTQVDATQFRFHGRIVIRDTPDPGRLCVRDGNFTFAITQKRKYWRLQEMEMCDGLTDYVDIYF